MGRLVLGVLICALPVLAVQVPAGTELQIRLTEKISSETDRAGQAIHGVVVAPVIIGKQVAIPAHAEVRGVVKEVTPLDPASPKQPALLLLDFNELGQRSITTKLTSIDNSRERLDADGRIEGMAPNEMLTARIDQGLGKLEQKYAGLAGILQAAKSVLVKEADASIAYEPGTEMTLTLTSALEMPPAPPVTVSHFADERSLAALVSRQPFQTYALKPPVKSDITNLMFIGAKEALISAFAEAGWSNAEALNERSKFKTAQAIIEQRGYKEAPVSVLILDDRPPDVVYQKGNNTFAARHHLRIWRSPDDYRGMPVWISSSTHDIGIDFSEQSMTFIHKIDPDIDRERTKVVNDLQFTGRVTSVSLIQRPRVPQHSRNATGDGLETDGAMAVMLIQ